LPLQAVVPSLVVDQPAFPWLLTGFRWLIASILLSTPGNLPPFRDDQVGTEDGRGAAKSACDAAGNAPGVHFLSWNVMPQKVLYGICEASAFGAAHGFSLDGHDRDLIGKLQQG
jgi:hypothetical protein